MTPSPLRSWWKMVSKDSSVALLPEASAMVPVYLPLLSVLQLMYSLPLGIVQATSYPLPVCSAAIGAQLPAGPAFFFNDTATTEIYTLPLHDALPISANVVVPECAAD